MTSDGQIDILGLGDNQIIEQIRGHYLRNGPEPLELTMLKLCDYYQKLPQVGGIEDQDGEWLAYMVAKASIENEKKEVENKQNHIISILNKRKNGRR